MIFLDLFYILKIVSAHLVTNMSDEVDGFVTYQGFKRTAFSTGSFRGWMQYLQASVP